MSNWYDNLDDAIDAGAVKTDGDVKRDFDVMEFAAGLARSIGQGITFGTADEAEGFVRSILGDQTYKQARDQVRKELEQFRSDYPKTAYGSVINATLFHQSSFAMTGTTCLIIGMCAQWTGGLSSRSRQ